MCGKREGNGINLLPESISRTGRGALVLEVNELAQDLELRKLLAEMWLERQSNTSIETPSVAIKDKTALKHKLVVIGLTSLVTDSNSNRHQMDIYLRYANGYWWAIYAFRTVSPKTEMIYLNKTMLQGNSMMKNAAKGLSGRLGIDEELCQLFALIITIVIKRG